MSTAITTGASPPTTARATARTRMSLSAVITGRLAKPMRVLVYGIEGVGKSTFAAGAPKPIFLGAEDGTSELDVARFPEPLSYADALDAFDQLIDEPHEYRTLVIDTLDWLEPLVWQHVCETNRDKLGKPYKSIEDFGFGKGYTAALLAWRELVKRIELLREKRHTHLIMLAHSWIKPFKNPEGEDFDRYEMKLDKRAAALLREQCDAVLFATHETLTYESNGRTKGISSGARVLYTRRRAAWDAKNRYDLPETLPLDWGAFVEAVITRRPDDPARIKARIEAAIASAPEGAVDVDAVKRVTAAAGDNAAELARILNKLSARVSIAAHQTPSQETP